MGDFSQRGLVQWIEQTTPIAYSLDLPVALGIDSLDSGTSRYRASSHALRPFASRKLGIYRNYRKDIGSN